MKLIGNIIKEKRQERGLSMQGLGNRLGVTFQRIGNWELGSSCPSILDAADLADVFNCSINELVGLPRPQGLELIKQKPFGDILREKRKARRISQVALAARLGASFITIEKWEHGEAYPNLERAIDLAEVFECSLDELIGRRWNG